MKKINLLLLLIAIPIIGYSQLGEKYNKVLNKAIDSGNEYAVEETKDLNFITVYENNGMTAFTMYVFIKNETPCAAVTIAFTDIDLWKTAIKNFNNTLIIVPTEEDVKKWKKYDPKTQRYIVIFTEPITEDAKERGIVGKIRSTYQYSPFDKY